MTIGMGKPQLLERVPLSSAKVPPEASLGGESDFAALFEEHFGYVWNTLRRLGVAHRDLEDVTHEVFLQVHRHLASYDRTRPVRPWLFGFAYRMASDYRQLARHRVALLGDLGSLDRAVDTTHPADDQLISHEATRLVHSALEHLELDQRAVLILHDLDGCAMKAIATTLAIPVNTAYSRLRLARARFTAVVRRLQLREQVKP